VREPVHGTVNEEHRSTNAKPCHRHQRNRHAGLHALARIRAIVRIRIFTATLRPQPDQFIDQLPGQRSEQETVKSEDRA
jgi:hypothetical protein